MKIIVVTNNQDVLEKYKDKYEVRYETCSYRELLIIVRDLIHGGHELLTHPLSGSVKPNETPYKSVLISAEAGEMDFKSLEIIENSMETARKFHYMDREIGEDILKDFRVIDLSLLENVVSRIF
jgi:hypothetical protein